MRLSVVSTLDKTDVITRHFLIWQLPARLKLNTNKCICSAIFNADAYGSKADADTNWLTPRMHWVHLYLVWFIANILMRNVPCFQLAETGISNLFINLANASTDGLKMLRLANRRRGGKSFKSRTPIYLRRREIIKSHHINIHKTYLSKAMATMVRVDTNTLKRFEILNKLTKYDLIVQFSESESFQKPLQLFL